MSKILKINIKEYSVSADIVDNLASEYFGKVLSNLEDNIVEVEFDEKHDDCAEIFQKTLDGLYKIS